MTRMVRTRPVRRTDFEVSGWGGMALDGEHGRTSATCSGSLLSTNSLVFEATSFPRIYIG